MAVFLCPGCLPPLPSNPPSWLHVKPPCPVAQYPSSGAGNCIPSLAPLVPLHWHSRHSPVGPSSLATLLAPLSLSNRHKRKPLRPPSLPLLLAWSFLRPHFLPLLVSLSPRSSIIFLFSFKHLSLKSCCLHPPLHSLPISLLWA